jgi:hypothetical protein
MGLFKIIWKMQKPARVLLKYDPNMCSLDIRS